MPIRNGYARDVFVVTSGEMMSLYAAHNIAIAVDGFKADGYARFGGLIQNSRDVEGEDGLVDRAAGEIGTEVVYRLPRSSDVQACEERRMTVVSGMPDSPQAEEYRRLAHSLLERSEDVSGGMSLMKNGTGCDCYD